MVIVRIAPLLILCNIYSNSEYSSGIIFIIYHTEFSIHTPTPVFLPGESQGWGAWWAAVYGVTQSQTRLKQLSSSSRTYFREGNGTPLQYSCLENPMDGGAWWATVHGVAKSQSRLSDFPLY